MKKLIFSILLLLLLVGGAFLYWKFLHVENPRDVYLRTVSAAMLGDEERFLDGFTEKSRPLVAGLLALARSDDARSSNRHPYYYLVSENVEGDPIIEGDIAWLKLRRMGDAGSKATYDVPLVKDGGTWKIDALQFTGKDRVVFRNR